MFNKFMLGVTWILGAIIACVLITVIGGCLYLMFAYGNAAEELSNVSLEDPPRLTDTPRPTNAPRATETFTPFEAMELAFEGNPSQRQIRAALDPVMEQFDLPLTDENYERAGSTLVSLRQSSEKGVTEMDILAEMALLETGSDLTFAEAAALTFAGLEAER